MERPPSVSGQRRSERPPQAERRKGKGVMTILGMGETQRNTVGQGVGQGTGSVGRNDVWSVCRPHEVAQLFQRVDLALYGDAQRGFIQRVSPDPGRVSDARALAVLRNAFEEWLTFDCQLDERGSTPFAMACRYWHEVTGQLDDEGYRDARDIGETQKAGWFRILAADAANGVLTLADRADGREIRLDSQRLANALDGVCEGTLVGRVAHMAGHWHLIGAPLKVSRRASNGIESVRYGRLAAMRRPGFADLVRMLYGTPAGLHASYASLAAYERSHGTETLWRALVRNA